MRYLSALISETRLISQQNRFRSNGWLRWRCRVRRRISVPLARLQDLILPVGIIASVLVILVPLPAALMDVLLSANITIAVIMLLTTIYVRTPLEFSIFPSLLLATTLFRLVLNVATTRLILTRAAPTGLLAAGRRGQDLRRVRGRRQDRRRADHLRRSSW